MRDLILKSGDFFNEKSNKGEEYLKKFPKLKKWINECTLCHSKGYKPSMPDKITNVEGSLEVYYLKKYFKPLSTNKDGLCPFCENKFRKK